MSKDKIGVNEFGRLYAESRLDLATKARQDVLEEQYQIDKERQALNEKLLGLGELYLDYISDTIRNGYFKDIQTGSIENSGQILQTTNFVMDAPESVKEIAARIFNTDKNSVEGNVVVISKVENGEILDILAHLRDTLNDQTINIPLSEVQKKKILSDLNEVFEKVEGISFEKALTDEDKLKLTPEQASFFIEMNAIFTEIQQNDERGVAAQQEIDRQTEIIKQALKDVGSIETKAESCYKKIMETFGDKMHDTAVKFEAVKNGCSEYFNQLSNDFFSNIKKASFTNVCNKVTSRMKDAFAHNIFKSVSENIYPSKLGEVLCNLANKNPVCRSCIQAALVPVNLAAHTFYAITGIKPTGLEALNQSLRDIYKADMIKQISIPFSESMAESKAATAKHFQSRMDKIAAKYDALDEKSEGLKKEKANVQEAIDTQIANKNEILNNIVQQLEAADVDFCELKKDYKTVQSLIKGIDAANIPSINTDNLQAQLKSLASIENQIGKLENKKTRLESKIEKNSEKRNNVLLKYEKAAESKEKYDKASAKWEAKAKKADEQQQKLRNKEIER